MRTLTRRLHRKDAGMVTVEYAVGLVTAGAIALVLYAIVRSDAVRSAMLNAVMHALQLFS